MLQLSIIVPVYNVQKYIGDCLQSLLNQDIDCNEYEIIVVDDGSTDDSGIIADSFARQKKNMFVFHKKNGGVSSARNFALEKAQGEYIWFVDGDDLVTHNVLRDISEQLHLNDKPDLLRVGVNGFEDGTEVDLDAKKVRTGKEQYADWIVAWIIKKSIIDDNSIRFDENVAFGEDDIFCVFAGQHIISINDMNVVAYHYRQREGSALHSSITKENFMKFVRSYNADLGYAEKYNYFWYKKELVYKNMPNIMLFVAQQSIFECCKYLRLLKEYELYPLPKIKNSTESNKKESGFKRIRRISYTRRGFFMLRTYLLGMRVRNKIRG